MASIASERDSRPNFESARLSGTRFCGIVGVMRYVRLAIVLAVAGISGACFHFSTLISVKPGGSGTLHERLVFTPTALAQLPGLASLAGGGNTAPKEFDPISEQQARDAAASFGTGVTYVS